MTAPDLITLTRLDDAALAAEASAGLQAQAAHVSPKFFYDALGSHLFDAITALEEYYPTRTEAAIFERHGADIADAVLAHTGPAPMLLDLGAGDGAKAARLFAALQPRRYVAVDFSVQFLGQALARMQRAHPALPMSGLGLDFSRGFTLPPHLADGPTVVFYPGSSIGNFTPDSALALLRDMHRAAQGGALLIGVDLLKPVPLLEAAYDDALGVTAAFNLNLLRHLNRRLGSDFDPRQWRHVACFDAGHSRIEMLLEARVEVCVRWPGAERWFAAGERIHTENSYKWAPEAFAALLRDAGFSQVRRFSDSADWFGLFVAAA
jgi:dimethylhistidine N-methyltransferase